MLRVRKLFESRENFMSTLVGMGLAFDKTVDAMERGTEIFYDYSEKHGFLYNELYDQMLNRAKKMAFLGGGHNKFLRAMHLDLIVQAPCDWWQQQATYTTTDAVQSTSTMHMLRKSGLKNGVDPLVDEVILKRYEELLKETNDLNKLKKNLPSGYMYIRTIHLNYMTLQHMYSQRNNHKEPEWKIFCDEVLKQIDHPYFIKKEK